MVQSQSASRAKIVKVLMDYEAKMEWILEEMQFLFSKPKEVKALEPTPFEKILDICVKMGLLPLL